MLIPRLARVARVRNLLAGATVTSTNAYNVRRLVASVVKVGSGWPRGVRESSRRRLGEVIVNEAGDIPDGADEDWATGRRDKILDGGLLNAVRKRRYRDIVHGVPLEQVVAAVDGGTSAIELSKH